MDIFDHLKNLTANKPEISFDDDEVKSSYNPRMINRYVSMVDIYLNDANRINKYPNIPEEVHYQYYNHILPKRSIYFKYIKKTENDIDKVLPLIAKYFECGLKEAKMYTNMLSNDELKEIVNIYKTGGRK